jgi:hypothetical protein
MMKYIVTPWRTDASSRHSQRGHQRDETTGEHHRGQPCPAGSIDMEQQHAQPGDEHRGQRSP